MKNRNILTAAISILILQGTAQAQTIDLQQATVEQSNSLIPVTLIGQTDPIGDDLTLQQSNHLVHGSVFGQIAPAPIDTTAALLGRAEYTIELINANTGEPAQLMSDYTSDERTIVAAFYSEGDDAQRIRTLDDSQYSIQMGERPGLYTFSVDSAVASQAVRIDITAPIAGACYHNISIFTQNPTSYYSNYVYGIGVYANVGWWDDLWTLDCKGSQVQSITNSAGGTSPAFDPKDTKSKSAAIAALLKGMGFSQSQISGMCVDQQCSKKGKSCYMDSLYSDDDNTNLTMTNAGGGKKSYKASTIDPSLPSTAEMYTGCSCE